MSYNKAVLSRVFAWSMVLLLFAGVPLSSRAEQTTVLVFSFENQTNDRNIDWIGEGLSDLITDRLSSESELYVFNRDERAAAYERVGIRDVRPVSRATAIKTAWTVGADVAIFGVISGTHEDFRLRARVLNLADTRMSPELE